MDAELRLQDFSLEDYQEMISGSFRDFFEKECPSSLVRETEAAGYAPGLWKRLVGMGVMPLIFKPGMDRKGLGLTGEETLDILGLENLTPRMDVSVVIHRPNGSKDTVQVICGVNTVDEVAYYRHGGILQYVLRGMAKAA